jgi:phosphate transport system substrate-binding protein
MNIFKFLILVVLFHCFINNIFAENITVKGSDTMVILGQKWAEFYMQKNPGINIQVSGGGSGTGFAALQNKTTEIANASRKIKATEIEQCVRSNGKRPNEYSVALDGITIYVNEKNKVDHLSIEDIRNIFTGKFTNWKDVGGDDAIINPYGRENSSGTYEFFKEHVLLGKDFSARVNTMPGTAQVLYQIVSEKYGIGYGGVAYAKGVKKIKISKENGGKAIEPSEDMVVSGKYPIWRYLYVYVIPDNDGGEIKKYIDWIKSDDGQKIVKEIGYYPLKKK